MDGEAYGEAGLPAPEPTGPKRTFRQQIPLLCAWASLLVAGLAVGIGPRFAAHRRQEKLNAALLSASLYGNAADIQRLLRLGGDPNASSRPHRWTPLMRAAFRGDTPMVGILIRAGADVNARSVDDVTPLWLAARWGHTSAVQAFLSRPGVLVDEPDRLYSRTPLMMAAQWGHPEIVRILLRHGAHPDAIDRWGGTALMLAAYQGTGYRDSAYVHVVGVLLAARADPNRRSQGGWTALMGAAGMGNAKIVAQLLNHHAEIDATDDKGYTALVWAARNDELRTARVLLARGADPSIKCADGTTALSAARTAGHAEMVRLLAAATRGMGAPRSLPRRGPSGSSGR